MSYPHRLNAGCGRDVRDGWCNLNDRYSHEMVTDRDLVVDLEVPRDEALVRVWRQLDDHFSFIELSHVIEHMRDPLTVMQNLWEVAQPDAELVIRCPYGSSDDADEDPTHVRRMFLGSFGYFSQPYYWRADYGYRGDWQPETIVLKPTERFFLASDMALHNALIIERNVVAEMVVTLRARKPAREPLVELQVPPVVTFDRG